MPRRRRQTTPDEDALWAWAVRDAAPLPGRAAVSQPTPPPGPRKVAALATSSPPRVAAPASARLGALDRREWTRLKRGELGIEARLDLHGLTQEQAHHALDHFIDRCWSAGRRMLLVITGKGGLTAAGAATGVIKRALPHWLAASRHRGRVLALATAAPRHGGDGAYYLRLKRRDRSETSPVAGQSVE